MMLTYEKLRNIDEMERNSSSLTKIDTDFYSQAISYIEEIESRIEKEKESPSHKLMILSDELRNTKRLLQSIFERREKKIVSFALHSARTGKEMPENMTNEEKIFYEELLNVINAYRKKIFEKKKDFAIVRIKKEIPPFIGNDMKKYFLNKEDVVCLPYNVAKLIIERDAGEEINANF
ncbi:MAG: hypothetical protein QW519_01770 [Candidatus Thermoplasmatota archaeon]